MDISINLIICKITIILLLTCSCSSDEGRPKEEKIIPKLIDSNKTNRTQLDTIVDTTRIINSNMALEVLSTYYPDSSFGEEDPQFIYAIFEQQIRMYNTTNDAMVLDTILPVKKLERNFKRLGKVEVLENVISKIGWTEGQKGDILFWVKGFGGCFNCSESIGFISSNGEVISFLYSRRGVFKIGEKQPTVQEVYKKWRITSSSPKKSITIKPFYIFWQW
jgi:hypothetical protein